MIKRALISVSDKTGIVELAKALKHFQIEIISTGGTAKVLEEVGVKTVSVSDYTGFPEMMEGRLKTLHPRVHGGLLGDRENPEHTDSANTYGIHWIDLLVVNLYPFESVADSKRPQWKDLIENIDIGGPAMIRAAAKNHRYVTVVVNPKDYKQVIQRLKKNSDEAFDLQFRYEMAVKAFRHTALYDSLIAETLSQFDIDENFELKKKKFPTYHFIHGRLLHELRYGENPHQKGAIYRLSRPKEPMAISKSLQGKELSFNNYLDADSAWKLLRELPKKSSVIVKHNNPCGVGLGSTEKESYERALASDPESAFGGILAISGHVDANLAQKLIEHFYEIVCAESFGVEAREILQTKKNLRLILLPKNETSESSEIIETPSLDLKKLTGSYLVQDVDSIGVFSDYVFGPDVQFVTERRPTTEEMQALRLAWVLSKNVKSNAVVITNSHQSLGIGAGEVNRRFATEAAVKRSQKFNSDIRVAASDGFFPFRDSIDVLKEGKVSAIVQPGGSIRDKEVIQACNENNIAMIFTKIRHFRH